MYTYVIPCHVLEGGLGIDLLEDLANQELWQLELFSEVDGRDDGTFFFLGDLEEGIARISELMGTRLEFGNTL